MKIFNLPDLGEGLPDAEIREWYVKVGDEVKTDDPLVSMETAKAVVDVPAPWSGKIEKFYGKAGDVILTDAPLVSFITNEKTTAKQADTGTVVGNVEVGKAVLKEAAMGVTPSNSQVARIKAMPSVRALARQHNVDLNKITASGTNGQITTADVENALQKQISQPQPGFIALKGTRRTMATLMSQAHAEVVPVTLVDDADISAWPKNTDISIRVIKAILHACEVEPALNCWYDGKANARKIFKELHLGLAMDSKDGLFVPVLKNVAKQSDKTLRDKINQFKQQVKDRSIPVDDLKGASFTLSNFGTLAGRYANPIIVPPTTAILGTGRIREEVVAIDDKTEVHTIMPLSLSVDHRAITGGEAARFLAALIENLK